MRPFRFVTSLASTADIASLPASRVGITKPIISVEWGPNSSIAKIRSQLQPAASHFVLPDLPQIYSENDRQEFLQCTETHQRIQTIAACRHEDYNSLLNTAKTTIHPDSKILLVGGNDKHPSSLSTIQAANILKNEVVNELWGVANPNDAQSVEDVQAKIHAGIQGIVTQPLLSSTAPDTLHAYIDKGSNTDNITILAGLAFPTTGKSLQFWAKLLEQQVELHKDPLFQSHLAFFSQPYFTPLAWIGRECNQLLSYMHSIDGSSPTDGSIHGIHCMPLHNMEDLCTMFQSFNAQTQKYID
ncbi:hypothetical protein IV203_025713 [Nitzschia inconspicua]|uniref:Uncharacterized protein n=1 Tax=Nitzschia inconspicua TaxID=303405 RepID=A0A9K3LH94_9STRA|nr:hypothetical protein IV203_025713 [Nitzschia inconspicua]